MIQIINEIPRHSTIKLEADLMLLQSDIKSFRVPLKRAIQEVAAPSIWENFEQGGRPVRWKALADSTVDKKQRNGASWPEMPLIETGTLQKVSRQLNIWEIDGIGGNAWVSDLRQASYGWAHEREHSRSTHVPRRPFLILQEEDVDAIENIFEEWYNERITRRLLRGGV